MPRGILEATWDAVRGKLIYKICSFQILPSLSNEGVRWTGHVARRETWETDGMEQIFIFCVTFVWRISHFNENWAGCYHKYTGLQVYRSSCNIPFSVVRFLTKLQFCGQILGKLSYIKFNENPSIGRRVVPCGRTDWQSHPPLDSGFASQPAHGTIITPASK
jgi:hypothetical protein